MPRPKLDKPTPLDYAVMIGGPLLFMLIAVVGLRQFAAPDLAQPSVARLRAGSVRPGMTAKQVIEIAGRPQATSTGEDGRLTYRYMSSSWDVGRATFVEEDAFVDFDAAGYVSNITFDSKTPEPPR